MFTPGFGCPFGNNTEFDCRLMMMWAATPPSQCFPNFPTYQSCPYSTPLVLFDLSGASQETAAEKAVVSTTPPKRPCLPEYDPQLSTTTYQNLPSEEDPQYDDRFASTTYKELPPEPSAEDVYHLDESSSVVEPLITPYFRVSLPPSGRRWSVLPTIPSLPSLPHSLPPRRHSGPPVLPSGRMKPARAFRPPLITSTPINAAGLPQYKTHSVPVAPSSGMDQSPFTPQNIKQASPPGPLVSLLSEHSPAPGSTSMPFESPGSPAFHSTKQNYYKIYFNSPGNNTSSQQLIAAPPPSPKSEDFVSLAEESSSGSSSEMNPLQILLNPNNEETKKIVYTNLSQKLEKTEENEKHLIANLAINRRNQDQ